MPKPSESPQFGPILRAPIQWVKKASKQWLDISFRVAHQPETTPFVDTSAFLGTNGYFRTDGQAAQALDSVRPQCAGGRAAAKALR